MILITIFGLVNLVSTDALMTAFSLLSGGSALGLLQLVSTALAVLLVLLLPVLSKRLSKAPAADET